MHLPLKKYSVTFFCRDEEIEKVFFPEPSSHQSPFLFFPAEKNSFALAGTTWEETEKKEFYPYFFSVIFFSWEKIPWKNKNNNQSNCEEGEEKTGAVAKELPKRKICFVSSCVFFAVLDLELLLLFLLLPTPN